VVRLLALAEVVFLAYEHVSKLEPHERQRIAELIRIGHGRRRNLSPQQREELAALVEKAEPRLFVGRAAQKLTPVWLPERIVRGRTR